MTSPASRTVEGAALASTVERTCPDCEQPAPGNFCPGCGQRQGPLHVTLGELFHEWIEEFLHFDGKLVHTLGPLLVRPGFLTVEYVRGRRTRYLRPFRLWFALSVTYFVLLSLMPAGAVPSRIHVEHPAPAQASAPVTSPSRSNGKDVAASGFAQEVQARFHRLTTQNDDAAIEKKIQSASADDGPHLVLVLVPIFAVLLKLLYRRTPLGEHFVFSFHLHAFHAVMAMGLLLIELSRTVRERYLLLQLLPFPAVAIYLPLALRRVHGQSALRTLAKAGLLFLTYLLSWALLQGALILLTVWRA